MFEFRLTVQQKEAEYRFREVPEMIQMQTILRAADNTGAKELMCIKVLGALRENMQI